MKQLIVIPLLINLFLFIYGTVLGVDPSLITLSAPGGYVFRIQLNYSIIGFSTGAVVCGLAFISFQVLGSGLGATGVAMINNVVIHSLAWVILSTVSFGLLWSIPTFGIFAYAVMSIFYAFGVFLSTANVVGGEGAGDGKEEKGASGD